MHFYSITKYFFIQHQVNMKLAIYILLSIIKRYDILMIYKYIHDMNNELICQATRTKAKLLLQLKNDFDIAEVNILNIFGHFVKKKLLLIDTSYFFFYYLI